MGYGYSNTSVMQFVNALPPPQQGSTGSGALRGMGSIASGAFAASEIMSAGRQRQRSYAAQVQQLQDQDRVQQRQSRRLVSGQRAAFGASGVLQSGTAAAVENQALTDMVLNNARILKGIRAIRKQASQDRKNTRKAATGAVVGGAFNAITMGVV